MGDRRFADPYWKVRDSADKPGAIAHLTDDDVIKALAHASREHNPYLANVLATEALNRMRRGHAMAEHAGDGILSLDAQGIILSANPAAARLLGRERESLVGEDRRALFRFLDESGRLAPADDCPVMQAIEQARPVEGEDAWFARADGSLLPVSYVVSPVRHGDNVEGAIVGFRDRTAHQQAQAEHARWMRLLDAFYRAHEHLGIGLVIIEGEQLSYASEAFRALVTHERRDLPHVTSLSDLIAPDHRDRIVEDLSAIVFGRAPERMVEFDLVRDDGRRVPVRAFVAPTEPPDAASQRVVCFVVPRASARDG